MFTFYKLKVFFSNNLVIQNSIARNIGQLFYFLWARNTVLHERKSNDQSNWDHKHQVLYLVINGECFISFCCTFGCYCYLSLCFWAWSFWRQFPWMCLNDSYRGLSSTCPCLVVTFFCQVACLYNSGSVSVCLWSWIVYCGYLCSSPIGPSVVHCCYCHFFLTSQSWDFLLDTESKIKLVCRFKM